MLKKTTSPPLSYSVLSMLVPMAAAAKIGPIKFQNQPALPIRSLDFSPVDGRPHPVSGSKGAAASFYIVKVNGSKLQP